MGDFWKVGLKFHHMDSSQKFPPCFEMSKNKEGIFARSQTPKIFRLRRATQQDFSYFIVFWAPVARRRRKILQIYAPKHDFS